TPTMHDHLVCALLPLNSAITILTYLFFFFFQSSRHPRDLHSFPTRRSSDLSSPPRSPPPPPWSISWRRSRNRSRPSSRPPRARRSEEHTSELQSPCNLVCRLLLEKKKKKIILCAEQYIPLHHLARAYPNKLF